jgi:hypothetical protein
MNRHLREEDICRWMAGERTPEVEEHLANCRDCNTHVARMSEVLSEFRHSVRGRSERALAHPGALPARGPSGLGWGGVAAAVLVALLIAVAAWLPRHMPGNVRAGVADVDDAALLRRVDAEVSRTVPGPMEPLASLIQEER